VQMSESDQKAKKKDHNKQSIRVGSRVMALLTGGGYAEYCVCARECVMSVPATMSMPEAAAIPEVWLTGILIL